MMQTQTQVPPALQVLMSMGAQPTAPGPMGQPIPTIASQKAEQESQGLQALMPVAAVQANRMAQAMQPVTQGQLQQVMQQQSPGISGLPAPNMQRMAEGGVVGYAGPDGSYVDDPETIALDELRVEEARRRREAIERKQRASFLEAAGAPQASQYVVPEVAGPRATPSAPLPPPEAQAMMRQQGPRTGIAAPRVEAPVRTASVRTAAPVAETGIATALPAAMTPEEAMGSARAGLGIPGTADLRAAIMEAKQAREQMPATGQAGLAALQQQMDAVKRMEEERKRTMASDRVIAQMLGRAAEGLGGGARADVRFMAGQRAAEDAFYERNVALAAKQDAINDANAARNVGNKEKYAEAMLKLNDAERAIAQAEATYAAAILQNAGTVRGQNVQMAEGAANRANAIELERMRRATADRPGETERIFNRFNELKAKDPAAAEQYLQSIERIKGLGKGITERQDVNELKALIASLRDQADPMKNMDKASREQASALLRQAQEKLAQMSGLGGASTTPSGPVRPTSKAEFDALPKGARYINPADGKEYIKN